MTAKILVTALTATLAFGGAATAQTRTPTEVTLDDLRAFTEVFARVQRDYVEEITDRELLEDAIRGMLEDLDPHSSYLTREQYGALEEDTQGQYGGVGIEVLWMEGGLTITRVMPRTPAAAGGVQDGDVIESIDGRAISDMTRDEAMTSVRGAPGTEVTLQLGREGERKPVEVTLERRVIALASVNYELLDDRYAYLDIATFQSDTAEEASAALDDLKAGSPGAITGIILDLRGNPGGVLGAAVGLTDLFLEDGLIVYTEGRSQHSELSFSAGPGDEGAGAPIVVLVDSATASASEIVAGALQD
ncbi:MAG: S41 family peptidase, partial [Pseudomonadota bacterium]